jgi:nitrogen fixation protein NifX
VETGKAAAFTVAEGIFDAASCKGAAKEKWIMRIAFASSDGEVIDRHFGTAEQFHLWEVGPQRADFIGLAIPVTSGEDREDKIVTRANALAGCTMVYTTQIGGPAAAKLVGRNIHPAKTAANKPIAEAIAELRAVLGGKPPPWLRKAAGLARAAIERVEMTDE